MVGRDPPRGQVLSAGGGDFHPGENPGGALSSGAHRQPRAKAPLDDTARAAASPPHPHPCTHTHTPTHPLTHAHAHIHRERDTHTHTHTHTHTYTHTGPGVVDVDTGILPVPGEHAAQACAARRELAKHVMDHDI